MERARQQHLPTSRRLILDWLNVYARLQHWQRNLRTRRQLAQLSEQELADVGISHAQRLEELDKPFWR